ncbi:hypothetical protein DM860_017170 [Cuscuta australis]|uniref:Uncharacterized protein n=1 Tax=Cuscuta australis TaxID=267555 RepID=A0A328DVB2_9ASTE|nr:hypothetical protein DM860_017170 [Cuscuta australis]
MNKMQCSKETIASLFYNASSSFQLLLLFSYLTSIFLAKILWFFGGNVFFDRSAYVDELIDDASSDEEDEKVEDDGVLGYDDKLCCMETMTTCPQTGTRGEENDSTEFSEFHTGSFSPPDIPMRSNMDVSGRANDTVSLKIPCNTDDNYHNAHHVIHHDHLRRDDDVALCEERVNGTHHDLLRREDDVGLCEERVNGTVNPCNIDKYYHNTHHLHRDGEVALCEEIENNPEVKSVVNDDPSRGNDVFFPKNKGGEICGEEICTVGSTSKSSSDEWRSTTKDSSCTSEDPFSSSSRRSSCPKWESYTVFQKYEEEMLFFDRISAQKLLETDSLRSKQSNNPRSISERIVYKFRPPKNQQLLDSYNELEAAYVAQICLTWEALCWNYSHFRRRHVDGGGGCPAYVAQQFQQFLVLLQRFIENEPYEEDNGCGRKRPEVYARVRRVSPKLLQVPQYRDSEEEEKREEGLCWRIPSDSFIQIMEESIRTFMDFMRADKDSHCGKKKILSSFFKKSTPPSCPLDPILLLRLHKDINKKKRKLKEMKRSGKCGMRKKKLKGDEEMEIVMAQIDLKMVSRVLRMKDVNGEQLHWCEDKMNKVRITHNGKKLHRDDSSPPFYPAH